MAEVSLARIDLSFGRGPNAVAALRDVSFDVPAGSRLAILGPSGCGKTTLLRVIAGLERPSRGTLRFDGVDIDAIRPERRRVGFVFASDALFPHLSARENIAYGVRGDARRRIDDVAERCRIGELLERKPRELSGGERQRVALARALASDPRVLLLDEPFSRLDAPLRLELRREIARIQREAALTAIVVTHDQEEALALGDRVAVMRAGRIEQLGAPRALVDDPATAFVAGFVGSPAMAFLPASALGITDAPMGALAGIRAADVHLGAPGRLTAPVLGVEDGAERAIVQLGFAGATLGAVVAGGEPRPIVGERVRFDVDPDRALLFDADGARLERRIRA